MVRFAWTCCMLAFSTTVSAQVHLVTTDGSGDFSNLQVAIDSVGPGATLLIGSDFEIDGTYRIRSSLQLLAADGVSPTITGGHSREVPGKNQTSVFSVQATPDSTVVFSGLTIVGRDRYGHGFGTDGVTVLTAREVLFDEVRVRGGSLFLDSCEMGIRTGDGVNSSNNVDQLIFMESSIYAGSPAATYASGCCPEIRGVAGGTAIRATVDVDIHHWFTDAFAGRGGDIFWEDGLCGGALPGPEYQAGDGGQIWTGHVIKDEPSLGSHPSAGLLEVGEGGIRHWDAIDHRIGRDGREGDTNSGLFTFIDQSFYVDPLHVGEEFVMSEFTQFPFEEAVIYASTGIQPPIRGYTNPWFLGFLGFEFVGRYPVDEWRGGTVFFTASLPDDPFLVGSTMALQAIIDDDYVTNPVMRVIRE